ncbi:MAG TPA: heme ABC exporter ATP-binding protein CcmA [Stellaceae bacterium]|nr:heme ABC exporter ATP-binding protein CcmA [Stellaceae bacterium]
MIELGPDLVAENLACRRGERWVFGGLSFCLAPGGALVLTGANGSGKTSLLRILATLLAPAAGRLLWGTVPVAIDIVAHRTRLHYVGHQDAVKPGLTPRETLAFWAALRGLQRREIMVRVETALNLFSLDGVADWPCRWLSAGQRRRLALARLIASPAAIWLLDEPSTGLDHDGQLRLERTIGEHCAAGGRVVVASHTPIDLAGAGTILLDAFAFSPAHATAEQECARSRLF